MKKSFLFCFTALFLWGIHGPAGRFLALNGVDMYFVTATRFWLGTLVFLVFILVKRLKVKIKFDKELLQIFKIASIGIFLNSILYHATLVYLPGTVVMLLENISPVFVILLVALIDKEKPKIIEFIALFISFAGVYLVILGKGSIEITNQQYYIGILLGVLTGVTFGYYVYSTGDYVKKYRESPDKIIVYLFKLMLISSIMLSPIFLFSKQKPYTSIQWFWLIEMGVFQSGFAYLFWNYSLSDLPSKTTSLLFVFTIFFTTINETIFLDLKLNKYLIFGGLLIIASGIIITLAHRKSSKKRVMGEI